MNSLPPLKRSNEGFSFASIGMPNRVARFAGLDLDDSGAEAAQKLTCGGGGPIGRQLHDEKTFEWFIHIVSTSCIFQSILIARTKDNKNARK